MGPRQIGADVGVGSARDRARHCKSLLSLGVVHTPTTEVRCTVKEYLLYRTGVFPKWRAPITRLRPVGCEAPVLGFVDSVSALCPGLRGKSSVLHVGCRDTQFCRF